MSCLTFGINGGVVHWYWPMETFFCFIR